MRSDIMNGGCTTAALIGSVSRSNRKKLMTTSQYIYRTLFLEGQNSDVTIVALGVDWCLHKVYLCQVRRVSTQPGVCSWASRNQSGAKSACRHVKRTHLAGVLVTVQCLARVSLWVCNQTRLNDWRKGLKKCGIMCRIDSSVGGRILDKPGWV